MSSIKKIKVEFLYLDPSAIPPIKGTPAYKRKIWMFDDMQDAIGQMMGILSSENTDDILSLQLGYRPYPKGLANKHHPLHHRVYVKGE